MVGVGTESRGCADALRKPPQLCGVTVHSLALHEDGPKLELLVEMPSFPDKPSKRWHVDFNTAQARLRFLDLREVTLSGWGTTNIGNLLIQRAGELVDFRFDCPSARLVGAAAFFDIAGISAYVKGKV